MHGSDGLSPAAHAVDMQKEKMKNIKLHPTVFSVSIGGYMGNSYSIEKTGNTLLYKYYDYGYELKATETILPSCSQWKSLGRTLDKIGIWEWETEYPNPGICDGTSWSVEIEWGDKKILTHGDNNYPDGNYDSNEFQAFIRAIRRLIGGKEFS